MQLEIRKENKESKASFTSFRHQPNNAWQIKEKGLKDEEKGHPLVIRVVDRVIRLVFSGALTLEVSGDVKRAVHPTVRL